jgi:hypothetical protein
MTSSQQSQRAALIADLTRVDADWNDTTGWQTPGPAYLDAVADGLLDAGWRFGAADAAPTAGPVVGVVGSHDADEEVSGVYATEPEARDAADILADGLRVTRYTVQAAAPAAQPDDEARQAIADLAEAVGLPRDTSDPYLVVNCVQERLASPADDAAAERTEKAIHDTMCDCDAPGDGQCRFPAHELRRAALAALRGKQQ